METAVLVTVLLVVGGICAGLTFVEVRKKPVVVSRAVIFAIITVILILFGIALLFNP